MKPLLLLIILFTSNTVFSQDERFIAFCAKDDRLGHAFVSLGYEDSEELMTVHNGTWGMYPVKSKKGGKSLFIGEVPGEIRDDFLSRSDYSLVVSVSSEEYLQALEKIDEWKDKNYELLESDCLSFVIEIANIIENSINIPERVGYENLPAEYLKALIDSNK